MKTKNGNLSGKKEKKKLKEILDSGQSMSINPQVDQKGNEFFCKGEEDIVLSRKQ